MTIMSSACRVITKRNFMETDQENTPVKTPWLIKLNETLQSLMRFLAMVFEVIAIWKRKG